MKKIIPLFISTISLLTIVSCSSEPELILNSEELQYSQLAVGTDELSVVDTFNLYNQKTHVFIDVREKSEYDEVHIKGVKLIPLGQIEAELPKLNKNDKYITICRSGRRSREAMLKMKAKGFNVLSMAGGMLEWEAKGYPVDKAKKK